MLTPRLCRALIVLLSAAIFVPAPVTAQTTYRWIDKATGQTVFSDLPPPKGAKAVAERTVTPAADDAPLPYATRQAAEKYPVTLYTTARCGDPCRQSRELLNGRGVPFTEKMADTEEILTELGKRLGGDPSIPSIFVGSQSFRGFEAGAWNNLLDLAGYPASAPYGAKPSGAFSQ